MSRARTVLAAFDRLMRVTTFCRHRERWSPNPEPRPRVAARSAAVGALIAPVVACLRGDDEGVRILIDDACEEGAAAEVGACRARGRARLPPIGAAARRRASGSSTRTPTPRSNASTIRKSSPSAPSACTSRGSRRRSSRWRAPSSSTDALDHGDQCALVGAVASCWWCAFLSARLRAVDPIEEAAAICRYIATGRLTRRYAVTVSVPCIDEWMLQWNLYVARRRRRGEGHGLAAVDVVVSNSPLSAVTVCAKRPRS